MLCFATTPFRLFGTHHRSLLIDAVAQIGGQVSRAMCGQDVFASTRLARPNHEAYIASRGTEMTISNWLADRGEYLLAGPLFGFKPVLSSPAL
jgi:hypothetical protein